MVTWYSVPALRTPAAGTKVTVLASTKLTSEIATACPCWVSCTPPVAPIAGSGAMSKATVMAASAMVMFELPAAGVVAAIAGTAVVNARTIA